MPPDSAEQTDPQRVLLACWSHDERAPLQRSWISREDLLSLLCGKACAAYLPRPGDWFCARCKKRNMNCHFWCYKCGIGTEKACITDEGVCKIPGAPRPYPVSGDWGCGHCAQALASFDLKCTFCSKPRDEKSVVVERGELQLPRAPD